jgi:cytoskeletal protein CcmA (bactofilin family)
MSAGKEDEMSKKFFKDETQINGLLDKGCTFEGKLTFDGTVQINGNFNGDIFSDGTLVVGPDAHVNAKIMVNTLIINGKVEGVVEAKNRIEIRSAAQLFGDILTPGLVVEDGAVLQGRCQMHNTAEAQIRKAGTDEEFFVQSGDDPLVM